MRLQITKRGRRLAYLGVGVYVIFLFASIPASFLPRFVLPSIAAAKTIKLQGVSGSLWDGQAINASINRFNLGRLQWELSGWGLLLGNVNLDLQVASDDLNGSGHVSMGFGGSVNAENIQMSFPAENLSPLFYGFPISFSGELKGNITSLEIEPGRSLKGQGRIVWQSAALRSPQSIELGDYLVTLEPLNRGTKLVIKDSNQGPIETNLTLQVKGTGDYKLNGWLKPRDESQQHITEALRLIGRADNTGRYWIVRTGTLNGWR